ncbi:hypothetical protein CGCSCA4_v012255 [Colletotrichum siamense]|uniref:Uncharacterized protein n=1 Tax=Colletotrichum siamense TaxID=690259 RepID=A0A9P5EG08_COLSI|nr:hypothetical protein CGCSCA4_v012255 [Colletotrichum siamense]KAF4850719.1 hypothetical protein CGCSCA2_v011346 [Colletotrichum siamense]
MDPVGALDQLTIEDQDDPVGNFFSTIWFDTEWHKVKGYCDPNAESYDSFHDYPDVRIPQSVLGDRRWSPEQIDARADELCRRPLEHLDTADLATLYQNLHDIDEALRHIQDDWPVKGFYVGSQFIEAVVVPPQEQHAYSYEEGLSDFEDEMRAAHDWYVSEDDDDEDDFNDVDGLGQPISSDEDDDVDGLGQPNVDNAVEAADGQESHHNANGAVQPEHEHEAHHKADVEEEEEPTRPFDPKPYSLNAEEYQARFHVDLAKRLLQRCKHIRGIVRTRSRKHMRPLNLGDMPHDILARIFAPEENQTIVQKGYRPPEYLRNKEELNLMKSLRLTCRSLADMIAPLLFSFLTVRLTDESLTKLVYISRHPSLGRGIKTIRIAAPYQDAFIAENPAHFVDHVLYIMVQRFMITDEATGRSQWCGGSPGEEQACYEFMAGVRNFHSLDRDEGFNARVPGGDWYARFSQHTFLFHCWNVYRNKVAEEFRVLDGIYNEGDNFVRLVADAIARMPNVETLTFSDHSHDQPWILKYRDTRNKFTQEPLFDLFTRGSNWDNARNLPSAGSQNRSLLMLVSLLSTIGSRNIKLKHLEINVTAPNTLTGFSVTPDARESFQRAMRNVEFLKFHISHDPFNRTPMAGNYPPREPEELDSLDEFLDCLLSSNNLRELDLSFESLREENVDDPVRYYLPSLWKVRPWPHLRKTTLNSVCMDSTKLKSFLGNKPLWITELHKPHMSFGTWTEALDVMREKYDTEWSRPNKWGKVDDKLKGLNIGGRLWEASGAECSTMTRMAYARAFSIPPGGWPKINGKYSHEGFWQAQHYISHEQDANPCRDV